MVSQKEAVGTALQSVRNETPRVASIALFGGVDDADVARCDAYIEEASE